LLYAHKRKEAYFYCMKARLNLTIDDRLLLSAKKYAAKNEISLSELVTGFFVKLSKPVKQENIIDFVERLEKLAIPSNADLKELY
jgi:hypothetical protein